MGKTSKKNSREKRVLIGAIGVAAVMVAGSTFAWFTSKDEVTNRLSASANYGVSIAEDFTPPENWVPGQAINKDAGAVNTGNVDAFVRMWLEGEMSVLNRNDNVAVSAASTAKNLVPVTDTQYTSLGLTFTDGTNYYRELSTAKVKNPDLNDNGDANESGNNENSPATFSEVQSVQAGGYLAYAPATANYYFIVEHDTSIKALSETNKAADFATKAENFELKEGDIVATADADLTGVTTTGKTVVYIPAGSAGINIDSSEFYPQTEGTYIFRRNIDLTKTTTGANEADDYEYSGYYYVPKNGGANGILKSTDTASDHYFALYTDTDGRSDYTLPDGAVTATTVSPSNEVTTVAPVDGTLKLYTASETVVENSDLKWTYTAPSGSTPAKLTAYYAGADGTLGNTLVPAAGTTSAHFDKTANDDIVIEITLANVVATLGTDAETWTAKNGSTTAVNYYAPTVTDTNAAAESLATNGLWTFYYNNDVEAGDTTTILVDSVTLSKDTTQYAFLAFDFDLNVFLESVQVTMDEDGNEQLTPVHAWAATTGQNTGADATATAGTPEIQSITWADIT